MNILEFISSQTYSNIVATFAMIVALVAVPASGYLSYKYAIKGERRKEFNAIADDIRRKMREHLRHLEQDIYPSGNYIEVAQHDFDMLIDVSDRRDKVALRVLLDDYQTALGECMELENGIIKYKDLGKALAILTRIMPYLERK